jgi:hypothetical protein
MKKYLCNNEAKIKEKRREIEKDFKHNQSRRKKKI